MSEHHDLYQTDDPDVPEQIRDRNGEVVLGLCRECGRGEIELTTPCDGIMVRVPRSDKIVVTDFYEDSSYTSTMDTPVNFDYPAFTYTGTDSDGLDHYTRTIIYNQQRDHA